MDVTVDTARQRGAGGGLRRRAEGRADSARCSSTGRLGRWQGEETARQPRTEREKSSISCIREAVHVRRTSVTINADGHIIGTDSSSRLTRRHSSPRHSDVRHFASTLVTADSAIFSQTAPADGVLCASRPARSAVSRGEPSRPRCSACGQRHCPPRLAPVLDPAIAVCPSQPPAATPSRQWRPSRGEGSGTATQRARLTRRAHRNPLPDSPIDHCCCSRRRESKCDVERACPCPFRTDADHVRSSLFRPAALNSSNLDISIVAPSEAEADTKPATPPRQSVSEFTSPETERSSR